MDPWLSWLSKLQRSFVIDIKAFLRISKPVFEFVQKNT